MPYDAVLFYLAKETIIKKGKINWFTNKITKIDMSLPVLCVFSTLIVSNSFFHLFNKYFLKSYNRPGSLWGMGDTAINKETYLCPAGT